MMRTNPLPVPVGASVFVSARGAQYILNAQEGNSANRTQSGRASQQIGLP